MAEIAVKILSAGYPAAYGCFYDNRNFLITDANPASLVSVMDHTISDFPARMELAGIYIFNTVIISGITQLSAYGHLA